VIAGQQKFTWEPRHWAGKFRNHCSIPMDGCTKKFHVQYLQCFLTIATSTLKIATWAKV